MPLIAFMATTLTDRIDALLPQTQCTKCGYDGCRPYATAIALEGAAINRCPPGGEEGIQALAALLNTAVLPPDTDCGTQQPLMLAVIDEEHCIGCTLCIQACPVDAIIGANKLMHTIIADRCTGCDLCVAPCPTDCISMQPVLRTWTPHDAHLGRRHYQQRQQRLHAQHTEQSSGAVARTLSNKPTVSAAADDAITRQNTIADALARARARRQKK